MEKLLGEHIDEETADGILETARVRAASGHGLGRSALALQRRQREVDLIEEVARIHGLDKLPTTLPARGEAIGRLTGSQPLRRRLEDLLRDRGLLETISYSFTSPETLARLRITDVEPLRIENPLSEDLSVMRPLLLPGLLDAAQHNAAHGRPGWRCSSPAHVYLPAGPLEPAPQGSPNGATPADERHRIGVLLTELAPAGWRTPAREADFFGAKALLEALMEAADVEWRVEEGGRPFLHPGRCAVVVSGDGAELGWIGEVHPLALRDWELPGTRSRSSSRWTRSKSSFRAASPPTAT
jgi:phenylalanyl-tRNA synthetase beta chain